MNLLKSAGAITIILVAGTLATAPAPSQSHPLSEIFPIDQDLNMSNKEVENVSKLKLNSGSEPTGLMLENLTIGTEGGSNTIELDYNKDIWNIVGSNLDLNGNNLTAGTIKTKDGNLNVTDNNITATKGTVMCIGNQC